MISLDPPDGTEEEGGIERNISPGLICTFHEMMQSAWRVSAISSQYSIHVSGRIYPNTSSLYSSYYGNRIGRSQNDAIHPLQLHFIIMEEADIIIQLD